MHQVKVARFESGTVCGTVCGTVWGMKVEGVLGKLCLLQARVKMYLRFVRRRCSQEIEVK